MISGQSRQHVSQNRTSPAVSSVYHASGESGSLSATSASSRVRVVIVEDQGLVRQGLRIYLRADKSIDVVGEADSGETGIAIVKELKPDVVVMDVLMPGMDGITATTEICRCVPTTRVIGLSSTLDALSVVGMVRAGAIGYLAKDIHPRDLCLAIHAIAAGQAQLAPEAAAHVMKELVMPKKASFLSPREMDVLKLLVNGKENKEIASVLHIDDRTVKTHVAQVYKKLDVQSRIQAVVVAIRQGLVVLGDETVSS
jgi:two-component system, NarL family, response regulator LiaR